MLDGSRQWIKCDLNVSRNQVREHRPGAAIGHVHEVHPCGHFEQLACHVRRSSYARCGKVELARIDLGVGDELRNRSHRYCWVDLHDERRLEHTCDSPNIAQEIEAELIKERCVYRVGASYQKQSVAIRISTRD